MTDRVQKLREKYFASRPCITAERLVLQTEAYKLFAGEAAPIFRAKVVNYIMEHMTTLIMDNELVVGTPTNKYRGANLHPEFQSAEKFYIPDIDEFPVRKCDPYDVAPEDRELILKTLNEYWLGRSMEDIGVKTIICTDISRDGAMKGTNRQLYSDLSQKFSLDIMASGGVSTLEDIRALADMNIYGAILGKALYTGAIDLADALKIVKEDKA